MLAQSRTTAMLATFARKGIDHATFCLEVRAVAQAAAEQGEFNAAMKGYEIIGKALGVFAPETHLHLTQNVTANDLARLSDEQLRAYLTAKPADADVHPDDPDAQPELDLTTPEGVAAAVVAEIEPPAPDPAKQATIAEMLRADEMEDDIAREFFGDPPTGSGPPPTSAEIETTKGRPLTGVFRPAGPWASTTMPRI